MIEFDTEFMSDEEVEEMLDAIVTATAEEIAEDESRTSIINPFRVKQLLFIYKAMKYMMRGRRVKVSYKLHEPYQSMGSVSITGADIELKNPAWFSKAVKFASNFEVYPKTDGTVCMTFTFHNLTVPIE